MLLAFAQAAGAEVNFDRGVDVQSAINTAVNSDIVIPAARFGQLMDITRDCREVTFKAEDPLSSPEIPLASMQTSQECQNMGYPAGQICWPVSQYYNAKAQIVITQPRVLQPGQKEVFEVTLNKEDFRSLMAGFYTMEAEVDANGKKADVKGTILFSEKDIVTTFQDEYGLIISTKRITKSNEGNVVSASSTVVRKNIISRNLMR